MIKMQQEFRDLVFEFAKEASRYNVKYLFLFGSVARGEADKRSDIDFLVVFDIRGDVEDLKDKRMVSNLALDLEKRYDQNIQVVFADKDFGGLDEYFIQQVFTEGILLYASAPKVEIGGLGLEPYSLITFSLKELDRSEKMKVRKALYGYKTKKEYKGKIYESKGKGLVDELGGKRIGIASVLIPKNKAKTLEETLKRFGVAIKRFDLWM